MINQSFASNLNVILSETGANPYSETASGPLINAFNALVMGPLLEMNEEQELVPGLIEDWKYESKEKSYILKLKAGTKFHSGKDVTSEDLEFALLRGFFSSKRSFYTTYLGSIDGLEDIPLEEKYKSGRVKGITIVDKLTIKIRLKRPNPFFLFSLTVPYFGLADRHALKDNHFDWKDKPEGAGNYRFAKEDDEKIILEKFKNRNSRYNTITLYKKSNKNVIMDVSFVRYDDLKSVFPDKPTHTQLIHFSNINELAKNENFKKAIYWSIDRKLVQSATPGSKETFELLPSKFWRLNKLQVDRDMQKAKEYWNKIPKKLTDKTWRVPVFSTGVFSEQTKKNLEAYKKSFDEIGFRVDLYPNTEKFIPESNPNEAPISLSGIISDLIDPVVMFSSYAEKSAYEFRSAKNDNEYKRLYLNAFEASDQSGRIESLGKLSKYFSEKPIAIPVVECYSPYFVNPTTVINLGKQPVGYSLFLDNIEKKSGK